ncbi:hypothetical protein ACIHCQ_05655 [Streptomyces sp. NPDC052236]|uniref:hypothetical protein n=1 Tax=Streptomyces sp. NPDC052236 TaxID=3365686 RepID=UPI0037D32219
MREITVKAESKLSETDKGQINIPQTPVLATPVAAVTVAFAAGFAAGKIFGK